MPTAIQGRFIDGKPHDAVSCYSQLFTLLTDEFVSKTEEVSHYMLWGPVAILHFGKNAECFLRLRPVPRFVVSESVPLLLVEQSSLARENGR